MSTKLANIALRNEEDVVEARRQARDIATRLGFDANDQTRLATAVSEIARNAFNYAGGGSVEFLLENGNGTALEIRVSDAGPGIADLKKILAGTYRSKTGMGMGIIGARRLMDDFRIESNPGEGTLITLSKNLPAHLPRQTPQRLAKLSAEIAKAGPRNVLDDLRQQNRE